MPLPLLSRLQRYNEELQKTSQQQSPSDWLIYFNQQLTQLGWPGERILNSIEYQLFSRFKELFEEFAALDWVLGKIDLYTAIAKFQEIATNTLFQEKTPQAQVQVLGLLEAAALPFSHLWIMGLDDETWPSKANPNPFIPFTLQRQYQLPHANAERELNFSQKMMELFTSTGTQIICSFSKMSGENTLAPSPLIKKFPEITPEFLNLTLKPQINLCTTQFDSVEDNFGPPILQNEITRGGSYLFKLQSLCPFRSFAEIRLWAAPFNYSDLGMAATERGSLLHRTLEQLWKNLLTQDNLHSYPESDLKKIIETLIDEITEKFFDISRQTHQAQFLLLEKKRLAQLLTQWLDYEKKRAPFSVVAAEETLTTTIANIQVKLKIDRIDLLETGEYLIIDYKTGRTKGQDLFGDRPSEPQLPLYCLAHPLAAQGVLFAQIRTDEMHIKGVVAKDDLLSKVKTVSAYSQYTAATTWEDQLNAWQTTLTQLAKQYQGGYAAVDPKDPKESCEYCHLQGLCRINEAPKKMKNEDDDGNS
jgi:ATP-dependent helicase/nuclease subunit B